MTPISTHAPSSSSHPSSCPCKLLPIRLSTFTSAAYGTLSPQTTTPRAATITDDFGYTPLHLSSQNNHTTVTLQLLSLGANPNENSCGATPLHRAAYSGAVSSLAALIDAGGDVRMRDGSMGDDMTVLHKAVKGGRYLAVTLILERFLRSNDNDVGMLLEEVDGRGRTAWDVARELVESGNEEEEMRSVARWDKVAGGKADWKLCMQVIECFRDGKKNACFCGDNDESSGNDKLALMCQMRATTSWETAFRRCIPVPTIVEDNESLKKVSQIQNQENDDITTLKTTGTNDVNNRKVITNCTTTNGTITINDTKQSNGITTTTNRNVTSSSISMGQKCGHCRNNFISLCRGKGGILVCQKCLRMERRRRR